MHQPVMVREVVSFLVTRPGGRYLDCTLGAGGHASAILSAAGAGAVLYGIDQDPDRIRQAGRALEGFGAHARLLRGNFSEADRLLPADENGKLDGIVADLGVSSDQLDDPARGFSFQADGPLDMRMDPDEPVSAAALLAHANEREIADILYRYGEERRSRRIARAIVERRVQRPFRTTLDLVETVMRAAGGRHGRIHPATRTFQALRIAVNRELEGLEQALPRLFEWLAVGGRLVVISFHSLEDRIVKRAFRTWAQEGRGALLTRKPMTPEAAEAGQNPRARSAKLRAAERR